MRNKENRERETHTEKVRERERGEKETETERESEGEKEIFIENLTSGVMLASACRFDLHIFCADLKKTHFE